MAIVYTLRVGCNDPINIDAEEYMINCIEKFRKNLWVIVEEAHNFDSSLDKYVLSEHAKVFELGFDSVIKIVADDIEEGKTILINNAEQLFDSKELNESSVQYIGALSRAICRLMIKDMHLRQYELSIGVT